MLLNDLITKIKYARVADRIGPDVPFSHWKLYFKDRMLKLCQRKFKKFSDTAEMRPGSYVVGCSTVEIGERVIIRPGCMFFGETSLLATSICIEDDVMMGAGVHIYINNHKFDRVDIPFIDQGYYPDAAVIIKKGSWIGANVILLPGITIGENTVIGAGSVVTKSIPANVVAVGNPAKVVKSIL